MFLRFGLPGLALRDLDSTKQSVHHGAGVQQLCDGGQCCRLSARRPVQIGPRRRDQRSCAVRQHEHEQQLTALVLPPQDLQGLTLKGVAPTHYGHPLGVAVEMVVMGIVSCVPSTAWIAPSCWRCSRFG